jgi:transitional endoplasmic reticulum ATPase
MSKFYGESEARLREIFQEAEQKAPSIIFIDELDAIAPKREEVTGEVERRVVAQLLALMDGIGSRGNIIVIGATNRPNAIDPALRRPGRFDREIEIGVPDKKGRLEILQIHTRNMPLAEDVNLKKLAEVTHGYTGADIAALCREAAMKALRRYLPEINLDEERIPPQILEKMVVKMEDFMNAYKEITPTAMREIYVEVPTVKWKDVGGLEKVKAELTEAIEWPLKRPNAFKRLGIKPPKGILLYGPPGCGKTLLAKAVANESEANFISIKGPEIFSKWVGESEKAIREVFRKGRTAAPSIIFFDEIDAIAPRRGLGYADSGVTERVISQLLTELDGIESLENVVVMGATNRPDMLDPAILRPGRFDKLIYVPAPDEHTLLQIYKIHTRDMPLAKDVDLAHLAKISIGYSGADVAALCREAAMNALRRNPNAKEVTLEDFKAAMNEIKPSITPDMETWYQNFVKRLRREKTTTPVAIT